MLREELPLNTSCILILCVIVVAIAVVRDWMIISPQMTVLMRCKMMLEQIIALEYSVLLSFCQRVAHERQILRALHGILEIL